MTPAQVCPNAELALVFQLSSGNVYQAGQLNLLTVLELTGQALQLLKEERRRVSAGPRPALEPADMQEKCRQLARALPKLLSIRYERVQTPVESWHLSSGVNWFCFYIQAKGFQGRDSRSEERHPGTGVPVGQEVERHPEGHTSCIFPIWGSCE